MKRKKYLLGISVLVLSIILSSCTNNTNQKKQDSNKTTTVQKEKAVTAQKGAKLKSSEVCYVNNAFMRTEQIPVIVDGKTYYGCCEGCVSKLKNNLNGVRFAADPLTGEKVDKATAYIVLKPNSKNDVLYFASEKNYNEFIKL
jgi:YHS domain-containing protein